MYQKSGTLHTGWCFVHTADLCSRRVGFCWGPSVTSVIYKPSGTRSKLFLDYDEGLFSYLPWWISPTIKRLSGEHRVGAVRGIVRASVSVPNLLGQHGQVKG